MYQEFIDHPKMVPIRNRTIWVHVDVPGQGIEAPDLPAEYVLLVVHKSYNYFRKYASLTENKQLLVIQSN